MLATLSSCFAGGPGAPRAGIPACPSPLHRRVTLAGCSPGSCFVLGLTALNYAGRFAAEDTPDDIAYQWTSSIGVVVQFGLMLGVLLLIANGLPKRELFALRRPRSWKRALGLAAAALVAIYVASLAYTGLLSLLGDFDPTEEQGLVPDGWDSSRAAPFIAFFLAVTLLAPIVEELTYRGLGFSLIAPYGVVLAIVGTGSCSGSRTASSSGCRCSRSSGSWWDGCARRRTASTRGCSSTRRSTPSRSWSQSAAPGSRR